MLLRCIRFTPLLTRAIEKFIGLLDNNLHHAGLCLRRFVLHEYQLIRTSAIQFWYSNFTLCTARLVRYWYWQVEEARKFRVISSYNLSATQNVKRNKVLATALWVWDHVVAVAQIYWPTASGQMWASVPTMHLPCRIQKNQGTRYFSMGLKTPRYLRQNSDLHPTIRAEKRASGVGCGKICRMSAKLDVVQSDADRQRFFQMPDALLVGYGGIGQSVANKNGTCEV